MRRKVAGHLFLLVSGRAHLKIICTALSSERVEPLQQCHLAFPTWWFVGPHGRIYFLESLAFGFHIGSRVDVGRVQAFMSKPAANHRHVNPCGDKTYRCSVAKPVWRDSLAGQ